MQVAAQHLQHRHLADYYQFLYKILPALIFNKLYYRAYQ